MEISLANSILETRQNARPCIIEVLLAPQRLWPPEFVGPPRGCNFLPASVEDSGFDASRASVNDHKTFM